MSNNRYTNAGDVGAGTTINNMASRVKSWAYISGGASPVISQSFGISSIVDIGVGHIEYLFSNPFLTAFPVTSVAPLGGEAGFWQQASGSVRSYTNTSGGALQDVGGVAFTSNGNLA